MKLTMWAFLKGQFAKLPPVAEADLTGKTVIVLGANTTSGSRRGQAAMDKLKADTGYKNAELWLVDLADFASVKQFADKFEKDGGRLNIFVENAGVNSDKYEATKDGYEDSLVAPWLLLLPHMLRTAREHSTVPRLVVVASEAHNFTDIPKSVREGDNILATLGSAEYCTAATMQDRYMVTKLLNVLNVRALKARLGAAPLIVSAINPGLCHSELGRAMTGVKGFLFSILSSIFAFTAEEGSRQLVWGAVGLPDSADKLRGEYINQCTVEEPSDFVISPEGAKVQDRIWDELIAMLGKEDPRVLSVVNKYLFPSV
ncbi:hypothetical protein DFH09DRAFT_1414619 [Mycena vulgaris]|nr:hypothetical protein DFH09DRAFT_1414619 [Mycena vulgaris]